MMITSKIFQGGAGTDIAYVLAANTYTSVALPKIASDLVAVDFMQIAAGICGIIIILARAVKTIAEAYLIKRQADAIDIEKKVEKTVRESIKKEIDGE